MSGRMGAPGLGDFDGSAGFFQSFFSSFGFVFAYLFFDWAWGVVDKRFSFAKAKAG
jgi:biotin transporter BioY